MTLFLAIAILSLAGFTQGLTGFGFGLLSMSLLPFVLPFKDATVILAPLTVVTCVSTLYSVRRHLGWRRAASMIFGACLGVPLGVYALVQLDAALLMRVLGGLMVAFAVVDLRFARRGGIQLPAWVGFPAGFASGSIGGAFNAGGPPIIAYTYSQPWAKEEIVATLQLVFGLSAVLRFALVGQQGLLRPDLWQLIACAAVPMFVSIIAGTRLLTRVPRKPLRAGVSVFLLVIGLKYLLLP